MDICCVRFHMCLLNFTSDFVSNCLDILIVQEYQQRVMEELLLARDVTTLLGESAFQLHTKVTCYLCVTTRGMAVIGVCHCAGSYGENASQLP
jgi:hypothetical protein